MPVEHYSFPYVKLHGRSYPLIPITLRRNKYKVRTFALLDSGASMCIFRPEIAKALHLSKSPRRSIHMGTPTGGMDVDIHKVKVSVKKTSFQVGIGFSKKNPPGFNIIGREGFFHHFSVCFNEMMRTVIMVPLRGLR